MTTVSSFEVTSELVFPQVPLNPGQKHGRIRIASFKWGAATGNLLTAAAGNTLGMARMPAGRVKVLRITHAKNAFTASATMALGHFGFTTLAGVVVASSAAAFVAAQAMDNANTVSNIVDVELESRSGFILMGTLAVAGAASREFNGFIEYVQD